MVQIEKLKGVDSSHTQKLFDYGIRSSERLLQAAATKQGRLDLAEETGIPEKLILLWVNLADLIRIKGIGEEYSALLEEAGVDTIKELRNRRADHLYPALLETNEEKRLVRRNPSLKEVEEWVADAKTLHPVVKY
jgi:predicted flap endonuclease-1-like 5' DNA nuclease